MPQSVISEHVTITPENLAKHGISGQNKEKQNYDKNTRNACGDSFHLPRQYLRYGAKALSLLGFLDGRIEFTPYLHLWKIGSVIKTCGD